MPCPLSTEVCTGRQTHREADPQGNRPVAMTSTAAASQRTSNVLMDLYGNTWETNAAYSRAQALACPWYMGVWESLGWFC